MQQRQKELKTQLLFVEANNMLISAREIRYYLTRLKDGNVNDINYRRMLINTFIYKIYLYDDKVLISYTTQEEKKVKIPSKEYMLSSLIDTIAPPNVFIKKLL